MPAANQNSYSFGLEYIASLSNSFRIAARRLPTNKVLLYLKYRSHPFSVINCDASGSIVSSVTNTTISWPSSKASSMKVKAFSSAEDAFFIVSMRVWHCLSNPDLAARKASFGGRLESGVQAVRSSNNFNWKFFCSGEVRPALFYCSYSAAFFCRRTR